MGNEMMSDTSTSLSTGLGFRIWPGHCVAPAARCEMAFRTTSEQGIL
jgi:hypothetical protein